MAFQAGAIVSKLSLDRKQFSASVSASQKQVKGFSNHIAKGAKVVKGMGLAIIAMGTAAMFTFKKMLDKYVEVGDWIDKMSKRTGFSATALSELAYAADISGASLGDVEKSVKRMARTITDANEGLESYIRPLRRIGLEAKELKLLSPEQQFTKITEAIASLEDPTLRAATAQEIFGRAGTTLLPLMQEGAEGIRILREEAHKLGIIFDEEAAAKAAKLKDAQTALNKAFQGLAFAIVEDVAPAITEIVQHVTDWVTSSRSSAKNIGFAFLTAFHSIVLGVRNMMIAWQEFEALVFEIMSGSTRFFQKYITNLIIGFAILKKLGAPVGGVLKELAKAWTELSFATKGWKDESERHRKKAEDIAYSFEGLIRKLQEMRTGYFQTETAAAKGTKQLTKTKTAVKEVSTEMMKMLSPVNRLQMAFDKFAKDPDPKTWSEKWKEAFSVYAQKASMVVFQLYGLFNQLSTNQLAAIDKERDARIQAIEDSTMTEAARGIAIGKIEEEIEKKRKKARRKQAQMSKAVALMEAIINTAAAVTEALPNIPFSILIGMLGLAQIAAIAGQAIPSYQFGGDIEGPGIVGEKGMELFIPRRPGKIVPLREEAAGALGRKVELIFSPQFFINTLDPATARTVVRESIAPELLEMFKIKIRLPEFQEALGIR